jgi:hypothetical protein
MSQKMLTSMETRIRKSNRANDRDSGALLQNDDSRKSLKLCGEPLRQDTNQQWQIRGR